MKFEFQYLYVTECFVIKQQISWETIQLYCKDLNSRDYKTSLIQHYYHTSLFHNVTSGQ